MARTRTAQQRDARELASTRPADPYRGALTDPFTPGHLPRDGAGRDKAGRAEQGPSPQEVGRPDVVAATTGSTGRRYSAADGTPGQAVFAGVLGIGLGLTLGILGLLLFALIGLQDSDGIPDRSFYRGEESAYVVLGLFNFGLAACCGVGGIALLAGRVSGRIALTVGGWGCLLLSGYWRASDHGGMVIPIVLAVAAAAMLLAAYSRRVTWWLGVLPPPQPE